MRRLVDQTIKHFGKLDILVNNAGAGTSASFQDKDYYERFKTTMNIDFNSVVYLTHICVKHLEKTKGNIINISSVCGLRAFVGLSPYCIAKAALDMFTKCMAAELGPKRIRVNVINPGPIRTSFLTAMGATEDASNKLHESFAKLPVGRSGLPNDVADSILYLASDHAAFITGTNLVTDGGSIASNQLDFDL
ncbi:unnamed protein product [Medioppia subpectinata]|uniref:Uncharacterized protein n=1 Tax=Medioppia subpectinata TaxID=1979941 RepID=A0A7R9LL84_9ACAR|nr:unnamed protein product [Medioppia subpectinata]CAG2119790.1 unnamed protein product [Medioppia subpectinata]